MSKISDWPTAAKKVAMPDWLSPMLATLTHDYFSDPDWLFERKLDGERCLVYSKNNHVELYSRNRQSLNKTYPELHDAMKEQQTGFIVDGEIVAFDGNVTSFSRLQQRMQRAMSNKNEAHIKVYLYVFDLLYCNGHDLTAVPLRERKALLKQRLDFKNPLRYTPHRNEKGEEYHRLACKKSWEGVIAKKSDSIYQSSRSHDWLKFKCANQQEFVIVGFTEPHGERVGFGALLIGYYEEDNLHYAGRVGTGYDDALLKRLRKRLSNIKRESCPLVDKEVPEKGVHWVAPKLVAEISFTEWTTKGRLRHPRFLGLRTDKNARQVVRERADE